jgi:hypothetical protein
LDDEDGTISSGTTVSTLSPRIFYYSRSVSPDEEMFFGLNPISSYHPPQFVDIVLFHEVCFVE